MGTKNITPALLPYDARIVGFEVSPKRAEPANEFARNTMDQVKRGAGKTFASWTLGFEDGLDLFNRLSPSGWWVRAYDLEPVLRQWGLRALDGIVACGGGAPSETVPVAAHIDSPRIAAMMAETYARLAKQRAIAEKWFFDFPEAAAIGLVPPAATGRGKAKEHARGALQKLVDGGKGQVVATVAKRYGLSAELADLLARVPMTPAKGAAPDLDGEVRDLERRLLRANASKAAYEELSRLTAIDTDRALFAVAEVTLNARSKPLRKHAARSLDAVRSRRGLSEDDLAVRMIPKLGLDEPEVIIAGEPHRLAASPLLEARIITPDGKRLDTLPRGASEAVKKRWALLGKELKTIAAGIRGRLETRMIAGTDWKGDLFLKHVVGHPILVELARGLLFSAGTSSRATLFRVAEDGTLADRDDKTIAIAPTANIIIPHPLDLSAKAIRSWGERFADYEILQPFPQLDREHFEVTVAGRHIEMLEGLVLSAGKVLALERRGWERETVEDRGAGVALFSLSRELDGLRAAITFEPGVPLEAIRSAPDQLLVTVEASASTAGAKLSPRALSEIARDLRTSAR